MGELIGATVGLEKLAVAAAVGAAAYTGAVVGSIAIASGRSLGCGSRISDMFVFTRQHNINIKGLAAFYKTNPEVFEKSHGFKNSFGIRAKNSPSSFEHA